MALIGGIDPNLFVSGNEELVRQYVGELLAHLKPYHGVILGSADTLPRGTRIEMCV